MSAFFRNLKIRSKLMVGYTLIFIAATVGGGTAVYFRVKATIEANIESELKNSTETILNMVKTAAATSIKNHLRAVAENNRQIVAGIYEAYGQSGKSEAEAKAAAGRILLSQTIGKTGYLYCVRSDGVAPVHPRPGVVGGQFLDREFVREQIRMKQGYIEYTWKNPEEAAERSKALYMDYFEPWDWIISASSYREEFRSLVKVSDFRDSILALKFGKTGYAYVLDSRGNLIVHPSLSGNYMDAQGGDGHYFLREICRLKNGTLVYSWKNPGEEAFREKIVFFNYIPEYEWIVACSSYLDEMYAPLDTIRNILVLTVCLILGLVFLTSLWINGAVIRPLNRLMNRFALGASGDLSVRMKVASADEIGALAAYFNKFMDTLEIYHSELNEKMEMQKETAAALRLSEEMFSKAFRCSPSGMFIASLKDARVMNVNESFLDFTGYGRERVIGNDLVRLGFFRDPSDGPRLMKQLLENRRLTNVEIRFMTTRAKKRIGLLSAEIVELWGEACILAAMEDLTESRRLEREILHISERERQKIAMDLHDDLCPQLMGIEVMTKILEEKLGEKSLEETGDAGKIRDLILDTIAKTRQLSRGLSPVSLAGRDLNASLEELAAYVGEVYGICCTSTCRGEAPFVPDTGAATHLYYIAHEAVLNAARHSGARNIDMDLTRSGHGIRLCVKDNGTGMARDVTSQGPSMGMGLKIMSFRAARMGADLKVLETPGGGVMVKLEMAI